MSLTEFGLIAFAVFFVFIGIFHRVSRKPEPQKSYAFPVTIIAASLFVVIGSGEYALSISYVRQYGWAGLSFLIGLATALILLSLFCDKIFSSRTNSRGMKYRLDGYLNYATPDFLHTVYGKRVSLAATIIVAFCFFLIFVLQIYVGRLLISAATGMPELWASILITCTVVAYAAIGRFVAIFKTDLVQAIIMYISVFVAIIASYFLHRGNFDFSSIIRELNVAGLNAVSVSGVIKDPTIIAVFLLTLCAAFGGADLWQRVNLAKSPTSAKNSLRWGALGIVLFSVLLYFFAVDVSGVLSSLTGTIGDPLTDYVRLVTEKGSPFVWPDIVIAIFTIGLLSAFISTADTSILLAVTSVQNEFYRWRGLGVQTDSEATDTIELNGLYTSIGITITGVFGLLLVIFVPANIVDQFLIVLGLLGVIGVPVFATLIVNPREDFVLYSLILGTIITLYLGYFEPIFNVGWAILIPIVPGILCFRFWGRKNTISTRF